MWKYFILSLLLPMILGTSTTAQKSYERGKRTGQQFPTSHTGQPQQIGITTNGRGQIPSGIIGVRTGGIQPFPVQVSTSIGSGNGVDLLPLQPTSPMAQIVAIDVQCQKQSMDVRIQFDQNFDGTIYSKNHFSEKGCRYVAPNSHQNIFEFTVYLDRCGTTFVDEFAQGGQAYLENSVIIQNHAGFQEVWDTARRIRCLWAGQFDKTVSSVVNVDMLDIVTITYSGDTVESYMDIQVGRGPFSTPVTGLVKIGETLTMVIYVQGADDFDIHVKDCIAHDGDVRNAIQLTDARGCVIKRKLMGPWQKTRQTGNTGASIIAFSFFQAFKFPDKMEVFLECNIEICKFQCTNFCPDYPDPHTKSGRKRREAKRSGYPDYKDGILRAPELIEPVRVLRGIRVVSPDDITISKDANATVTLVSSPVAKNTGDICMSTPSFVTALIVILAVMVITCLVTAMLCVKVRRTSVSSPASSMLNGFHRKDVLCK